MSIISRVGEGTEKMRDALRAAEKRELEALAELDEATAEIERLRAEIERLRWGNETAGSRSTTAQLVVPACLRF